VNKEADLEFKNWAGPRIEGGEDLEIRTILQKLESRLSEPRQNQNPSPRERWLSQVPSFKGYPLTEKEDLKIDEIEAGFINSLDDFFRDFLKSRLFLAPTF
jgi:hypothetical protein